jgi:hypothetical protein
VIAIGGNDALQSSDLLTMRVTSSTETLQAIAERIASFERNYRSAIDHATALGLPTIICTIYNGMLEEPRATLARLALALFNYVILRTATHLGLDVLELRGICTAPADYANPIEPSGLGGLKIARGIARAIRILDTGARPTCVWGGH